VRPYVVWELLVFFAFKKTHKNIFTSFLSARVVVEKRFERTREQLA
jgi:hypothetical protein